MAQINLSGSIGVPGSAPILGSAEVIFVSDANHTLSSSEYSNYYLHCTSSVTLTAQRDLIAPLTEGQSFAVDNRTTGTQNIRVIGASGAGVIIPKDGLVHIIFCDGVNYKDLGVSTGSLTLSGDVNGPANSNTVNAINGTIVPATPSANQVLIATGSTTSHWASIFDAEIASAANIAVSKLASGTAGQILLNNNTPSPYWQTPYGDATIDYSGHISVIGIQGNSFSSGAPIEGQFVVATSTGNYGPVTLSGDISESNSIPGKLTVIGLQGSSISSTTPTGTNTQALVWNGSAWAPTNISSFITWANDLSSSSSTHQYVSGISGASGGSGTVSLGNGTTDLQLTMNGASSSTPPALYFNGSIGVSAASTSGNGGNIFTISGNGTVAASGTAAGGVGGNITIQTGNGAAGLGTNQNGGNGGHLVINIGSGGAATGSGTNGKTGFLQANFGGTPELIFDNGFTTSGQTTLTLNDGSNNLLINQPDASATTTTNTTILGSNGRAAQGGEIAHSSGAGGLFTIASGNGGAGASDTFTQGGNGGELLLESGNGGSSQSTSANTNGGNIVLTVGAAGTGGSGAAGAAGNVIVTNLAGFGDGYVGVHNSGVLYWSAGPTGGGGSPITWASDLINSTNTNQYVSSLSYSSSSAGGQIAINGTGSSLQWATGNTAPTFNQASTSSGSGSTFTIQAQNATGASHNGGELLLAGGTSGSATAGTVVIQTAGMTRLTAGATGVITVANLGTGVVHADSSGNLTSSTIVNADISSSAAIAVSKLASGTSAQILMNNGTPTPTWTSISGDISTTNAGVVTVTALQGNAIQSGTNTSSQDGYVLTWVNGSSQYQLRSAATTVSSGVDYSFSNTSSDISGYQQLLNPATGSESDLSQTVTSGGGKTLIKAFATVASDPDVTVIPAGLWTFNYYSYVSVTGAFTTNLVFDVYTRTSGGTETLMFSVSGSNLTVTSVGLQRVIYNQTSDTVIANTSRIVIKVSAVTTSVTSVTAHFVFDGATHASFVETPLSGAALQLGGDLSGTTSAATVVAISGSTPIVISPNELQWKNTAIPVLDQANPTSVSSGAGTAGNNFQISAQNGGNTTASSQNGGNAGTLALYAGAGGTGGSGGASGTSGDVVFFTPGGSSKMITISGSSAGTVNWGLSAITPVLQQTAQASTSSGSGAVGANFSILAQAGQAATGASHNGGNGGELILSSGAGGTSGSATAGVGGDVLIQNAGTNKIRLTYQQTILNDLAGSGAGYVAVSNTGALSWSAGSGSGVSWASDLAGSTNSNQWVAAISGNGNAGGSIPINATTLAFANNQSSPTINQSSLTTTSVGAGSNGQNLTLIPQAGQSSSHSGSNGGNSGNIILTTNLGGTGGSGGAAGTDGQIIFQDGHGSNYLEIFNSSIQFDANQAGAPIINQATKTSTSGGSGSAGQALQITAQTGQSATGASNNGGNGGNLILSGGAGGTSGSATAGHPGFIVFGNTQRRVVSGLKTSNYTVVAGQDDIIGIGTLTGSITITLPSSPTTGDRYIIKDVNGSCYQFARDNAGTITTYGYVVTISPASGNIDGQSKLIMDSPYMSVELVYTGSQWSTI